MVLLFVFCLVLLFCDALYFVCNALFCFVFLLCFLGRHASGDFCLVRVVFIQCVCVCVFHFIARFFENVSSLITTES